MADMHQTAEGWLWTQTSVCYENNWSWFDEVHRTSLIGCQPGTLKLIADLCVTRHHDWVISYKPVCQERNNTLLGGEDGSSLVQLMMVLLIELQSCVCACAGAASKVNYNSASLYQPARSVWSRPPGFWVTTSNLGWELEKRCNDLIDVDLWLVNVLSNIEIIWKP